MKFCKDCKHGQGPRCGAAVSLVTGKADTTDYRSNKEIAREAGWFAARFVHNVCGREGRWFEPLNQRTSEAE